MTIKVRTGGAWVQVSDGSDGTGTTTDVLVSYTGRSAPCSLPITVTGTTTKTINIPSSSNAFGAKYVQTTQPTGTSICEGDIWYDTSQGGGGGGGGGSAITVKNQGSALSTAAETLNFVGNSVVASGTGAEKTITVTTSGLSHTNKTSSYNLVASDDQKLITTDSTVTVQPNVFSAGNAITIVNNSTSNISINEAGGVSMYLSGTSTTGNRTLTQKGLATIVCIASNTFIISGGGLY